MRNINDIIAMIKTAVDSYLNSKKPTEFCYGEVISEQPIKIKVDSKLTLEAPHLIFTRNVLDHEQDWIDGVSSPDIESRPLSNVSRYTSWDFPHEITTRQKFINRLEVGDRVLLLRVLAGQKYVVLDREWHLDDTAKQQQY